MPLFTYVMSHRNRTKVSQHRFSNPTGFMLTPIADRFPELKPFFGQLMCMRPELVPGVERTWTCSTDIAGEAFVLHVIETKG